METLKKVWAWLYGVGWKVYAAAASGAAVVGVAVLLLFKGQKKRKEVSPDSATAALDIASKVSEEKHDAGIEAIDAGVAAVESKMDAAEAAIDKAEKEGGAAAVASAWADYLKRNGE